MNKPKEQWGVPYIPPGGVVRECLLPDDCTSCDDRVMSRPLRTLARFDWPQLKRVDNSTCRQDPQTVLEHVLLKHCAGLAAHFRPDVGELREAFRTGRFTAQHKIALDWVFSSMRTRYIFPGLIAGAELPIFEVARCFWVVFDGASFGTGPWLNQWADDPSKPHPSAAVARNLPPARRADDGTTLNALGPSGA